MYLNVFTIKHWKSLTKCNHSRFTFFFSQFPFWNRKIEFAIEKRVVGYAKQPFGHGATENIAVITEIGCNFKCLPNKTKLGSAKPRPWSN